jgi:sodium/proline symporter
MDIKLLILTAYLSILFLIGIWTSRKIKSIGDFYVGGKSLGYWVVAFSARATGESGWLLLGLTGMGAMIGIKAFWVVMGEVLGVAICWLFMAKKFKWLSDSYNSMTIPDFLTSRFGSKGNKLRLISATVLCIFNTSNITSQIDATGSAFETFFNINYFTGAIIGFGIVVAYIFFGGFLAVAWSDLFQGVMMLIGLVFLPIAGFAYYSKINNVPITETISSIDPSLLNIWGSGGFTLMNILGIIGFLMIGAGFLGAPQLFVRFMSIKDENEIRKGTWVAILFTIVTDCSAVLAGIAGRALFTTSSDSPVSILGNGAQNVLPMLVEMVFPSIIVGLYIAAVLSAIMSTIDSLLVVSSSAITRDIYQQVLHPEKNDAELTTLSRVVTIAIALASLALALTVAILSPSRTIFWFVMFGWSGIAACFCPMMILSLTWSKFTENGAIASMITGFIGIPFFTFVAPNIPGIGHYITQLSALPPSIALAITAGVVVSITSPNPHLEKETRIKFAQFKNRNSTT